MEDLAKLWSDKEIPLLDILILETLYQTGFRKSELCNLLLANVDLDDLQLKITGKGNKERRVPISLTLKTPSKNF